jgi:hypothetical protein
VALDVCFLEILGESVESDTLTGCSCNSCDKKFLINAISSCFPSGPGLSLTVGREEIPEAEVELADGEAVDRTGLRAICCA